MKEIEKNTLDPTSMPGTNAETSGVPGGEPKASPKEAGSILRSEDELQEDTVSGRTTWRGIITGEFLLSPAFRRQIPLLLLILFFTIAYIDNRFTVQQQIIEIDKKEKILTEMKYIALTRSSELTEATRQSRIEEAINAYQSELVTATNPPFLVRKKADGQPLAGETAGAPGEKARHSTEKAEALSNPTPDSLGREPGEFPETDEP